jgi:hypothetical protein
MQLFSPPVFADSCRCKWWMEGTWPVFSDGTRAVRLMQGTAAVWHLAADSTQLTLSVALSTKTHSILSRSRLIVFLKPFGSVVGVSLTQFFSSLLVFCWPISLYFSQDHSIFSSLAIFLTIVLSLSSSSCSPLSYSPVLLSLFAAFCAWRELRAITTQMPCSEIFCRSCKWRTLNCINIEYISLFLLNYVDQTRRITNFVVLFFDRFM